MDQKDLPESPPEQSRLSDVEPINFPEAQNPLSPKSVKSEGSGAGSIPVPEESDSIQISKTQIMRMMAEINMLKQNQMRKEAENLKEVHKEKEVRKI